DGGAPVCGPAYLADGGTGAGTNGGCWVDQLTGSSEGSLGSARKAADDIMPASATEVQGKFRQGAQLVVVILGDADDQSTGYTTQKTDCAQADGGYGAAGACENANDFV